MVTTYHYNDKIQPTPCICEVDFEAERQPFDQHLQEKNYRKYSVHIVKDVL